jgi:hypothetical protein
METWWAWFISWTKKWRCDEILSTVKTVELKILELVDIEFVEI